MDSLTQIVLGAAVGEAVLGKKVGIKAALWGAIAGTIPDMDVISRYFVDGLRANELHRGFSHSIIFCIMMAPLLGWIISKIYKNKEADFKDWTKLSFMSLVTHPLLDAHTTWGTQLFWPLDYKVAFNNIFVADPLYTLPFLILLLFALFSPKGSLKRKKYNNLGLIISSSYILLTIGIKGVVHYQFSQDLHAQNINYIELETRPTPLNSILWSANAETDDAYYIGYYSLLDTSKNISFKRLEKNRALLGDLVNEDIVKRLIKLSGDRYLITRNGDDLFFNDLRFGMIGMGPDATQFVYSYKLSFDQNNKLIAEENPKSFDDAGKIFAQLFIRIKGI